MKTIKDFFAHPLIQMALVLGAVTIIMAYFSKRVLPDPLMNWELALPAILASLFQGLTRTRPSSPLSRPWIGMVIVVAAAGLIIALNY